MGDANQSATAVEAPSIKRSIHDGVYVPPAKRRMLEKARIDNDNDSTLVQRRTWETQKRIVHGTINRLNAETIKPLIHDLFDKVNLIRLRGVLAKSVLQAALTTSLQYAGVYAALVAVINSKLPEVGELVVKRAILAFRRHYRRREKQACLASVVFLGQLFHQAVLHELIILQILSVLLDGDPTDDSVEVAVVLLTTTGYALLEVSPAGVRAVLERLRALLHEGSLSKRVELQVEKLLALRKNGFRDHPPIPEELDLIDADDQITFELSLDDEDIEKEDHLDVFRVDPDFEEHEQEWSKIRAEILGLNDDDEEGESATTDGEGSEEDSDGEEEVETEQAIVPAVETKGTVVVQDLSESDLVHLRRTIYLTIMSSATFEECAHKLARIDIPPGREEELINMLIECCSQERTFLRYYGLIASRFCLLDDRWRDAFMDGFVKQYTTIHRLETNKLRNVAKLFAHLLHSDAIPWSVLSVIHLNEEETTSSSRIFIKILVQEIAEAIGVAKLKDRFETDDPERAEWFKGMFPRDNVRNTRYAINFFTSIGLGPLTDGLREFLKNAPKLIMAQAKQNVLASKNDDDSSVVSSSSSSSSSSLSTSSSSSSSNSSYSSGSIRKRSRGRRRRSRSSSYSSRSASSSRSSSRSRSRSPPPPDRRRSRSLSRSRSPPRSEGQRRSRSRSSASRSPERTRRRSPSDSRSPSSARSK